MLIIQSLEVTFAQDVGLSHTRKQIAIGAGGGGRQLIHDARTSATASTIFMIAGSIAIVAGVVVP